MAHAVAASSGWPPGCAAVIARRTPPALALLGELDGARPALLAAQGDALAFRCRHFRCPSYAEVEESARLLARRLEETFGREDLQRFSFAAIPRGGLIVLGMLAYALGLSRNRLSGRREPAEGGVVVLVDDCALGGTRFRQALGDVPAARVVFAHLWSAPSLRRAIESAEPRVRCVAAHDLEELAEAQPDEAVPGRPYWAGRASFLGLPWGEPETSVRDPETGRFEAAWRLTPPRPTLAARGGLRVVVQPEGSGPLRPGEDVLFGEWDGAFLLARDGRADVFRLAGPGAEAWRAMLAEGTPSAMESRVGARSPADERAAHADVSRLVEVLLRGGWIRLG